MEWELQNVQAQSIYDRFVTPDYSTARCTVYEEAPVPEVPNVLTNKQIYKGFLKVNSTLWQYFLNTFHMKPQKTIKFSIDGTDEIEHVISQAQYKAIRKRTTEIKE
jgi:hypothetical protein